jgi:hypothetical protein
MFTRDKPRAAQDLSELQGDPWQVGHISDAPADPAERQRWAEQYDENIAAKLAHAGVGPDHPHFDALYKEAVNLDTTHSVAGLEHGHELPLRKREALLYAPQSEWQAAQAQGAQSDALLREYQARNPDLADDLDGMSRAIDVTLEWYRDRGEEPMANASRFLTDVQAYHRAGVSPQHDYGRTSGIGASGGAASGAWEDSRNPMDDDQGMVGEIRALQTKRGW